MEQKTIQSVVAVIGKRVLVDFTTINQGNGSEEEQETGALTGAFTGEWDQRGRTLRFEFLCDKDQRKYYLFVDEITGIEVLPDSIQPERKVALPPNCPNCNGEREESGTPGRYNCHFCGLSRHP